MKKIVYWLFMLPLFALLNGCDDTDTIIFDDELPQFEIKANAILLEVIMPKGSAADDEYYIVGDFNGGAEAAVGNLEWQLEKATGSESKWGIYLLPSTFKDGKTLADGFYFVSASKGEERSVKNEAVVHQLDVKVGTRTNVWVDRWKAYFETEEEGHDGFVVYVADKSGWDNLYLYGWAGAGDVTPAWPGIAVKGTEVINGVTYKYFDMGKALDGYEGVNLIFNNNDGKQFDGPAVTLNRNFYFRITDKGYEEIDPEASYFIYVDDQSGWGDLALYISGAGDNNEDWPGLEPAGTKEINGVVYKYFETDVELMNQSLKLTFNNNKQEDDPGLVLSFVKNITFSRDFYFSITPDKCEEIDPATHGTSYSLYVEDNTGWGVLALYSYGDVELGGGWPGIQVSETKEINGTTYKCFHLTPACTNKNVNLIFNNNNGGSQLKDYNLTIDRDYYLRISEAGCNEIKDCTVYVQDNSGWEALTLYGLGDAELGGGWPGMQVTGTKEVNGMTYKYFDLSEHIGKNVNLIFNNNGGGQQIEDGGLYTALIGDIYFSITATSYEKLPKP